MSGTPPQIVGSRRLALPASENQFDEFVNEIRDFTHKVGTRVPAVVGLSHAHSSIFLSRLPTLSGQKFKSALRWEMQRLMPTLADGMRACCMSWPAGLPEPPTDSERLGKLYLIAAADDELVSLLSKAFRAARIKVLAVEPCAMAACRAGWLASNGGLFLGGPRLNITIVLSDTVYMSYGVGPVAWGMREVTSTGWTVAELCAVLPGEVVRAIRLAPHMRANGEPSVALLGKETECHILKSAIWDKTGIMAQTWQTPTGQYLGEFGVAVGLTLRV